MSSYTSKKATIALSGGVDSSVAAVLLKERGYQTEGVFMRLGTVKDNESEKSARAVAEKLGIKFHVLDLSKEFRKKIINYFISEYEKGRTPNPCVECNKEIKFGILMDRILMDKNSFIVTGHYVRLQNVIARKSQQLKQSRNYNSRNLNTGLLRHSTTLSLRSIPRNDSDKFKLLKAKDKNKDQSYFLYTLNQKKLKHCLFPVGDYTKNEIRKIAKKYGLKTHNRKESQEICFIQNKYYGNFLEKYIKLISGDIIDKFGNVLGKHKGLSLYTIGQRRNIEIGGTGPYYVVGVNKRKNQIIVSNNEKDQLLFSKEAIIKKVNWISGKAPNLPLKIKAKTRYRMDECSAIIDKEKAKYIIKFFKSQRAIMPGQSAVFYKGEEILGGGIISAMNE